MKRLAYLGPEGTFTHQAALALARPSRMDLSPAAAKQPQAGLEDARAAESRTGTAESPTAELIAVPTVGAVYALVAGEQVDAGVVAIENTVEGYVVPSLDAIVGAANVIAIDEAVLDITFDAFVHPAAGSELTEISAHPHGLAQCQEFTSRIGLATVPATSNAAACRDISPHQIALGPSICGELYDLPVFESGVEDFHGARTRFLLIAPRNSGPADLAERHRHAVSTSSWRTMLAITPSRTGAGVLARITQSFGACGVNLSSLITRPLKAQEGKYVFVLTVDAAPWNPEVKEVFRLLLEAGDSLKTLGVFPGREDLDDALDLDRVPAGSVQASCTPDEKERGLLWR